MHIASIDIQLTESDMNENITTTDKKKINSKMGQQEQEQKFTSKPRFDGKIEVVKDPMVAELMKLTISPELSEPAAEASAEIVSIVVPTGKRVSGVPSCSPYVSNDGVVSQTKAKTVKQRSKIKKSQGSRTFTEQQQTELSAEFEMVETVEINPLA